jgi:hypothetical protein
MIKPGQTIGACVISRNDGYGGDQPRKFLYCLHGLLAACDEVIYVDWNSPGDISLLDLVRDKLPLTGKLRHIQISQEMAGLLTDHSIDVQLCVEVLARNIGLRRLTTDYRIACNGDILCGSRRSIEEGIIDGRTFHCVARREARFQDIVRQGEPGSAALHQWLHEHVSEFPQHASGSPLGERDEWSLITCPGDFQLAHRDVWHGIRGFEESLIMRGYTDSNVQKKAALAGLGLELVRNIAAFHFGHYPNTGASGGSTNSGWNDADKALWNFERTTNPETWGFSQMRFLEERL